MSPSCPISTRRVDANMVRIISLQVVFITIALIVTAHPLLAYILFFDFSVRLLRKNEFSLFHIIGNIIINKWGISPKLCDESPKRFALSLGFMISLLIALFYTTGFNTIGTSIAIILVLCSALEVAFDFCIGCKLYYAIQLTKKMYK